LFTGEEIIQAKLSPLSENDFESVSDLAATIWHQHYIKIISINQIDYMLAERYKPEDLREYLNSTERWFDILWLRNTLIGYCSYSLTSNPDEMKLEQLYLLENFRGKGLGSLMLRHIEAEANAKQNLILKLQVNKRNFDAISFYQNAGFTVSKESRFDIGNGYFMDDYVMEKSI